jgi:hypothetical protein
MANGGLIDGAMPLAHAAATRSATAVSAAITAKGEHFIAD